MMAYTFKGQLAIKNNDISYD